MNKENTDRIFYMICAILLGGIGFFIGGTYEQSSHQFEQRRLVDSIDVQQAVIDHYEYNADYNAMYNFKAKEVTEPCRKCSTALTEVQRNLDSIEDYKGKLVVPQPKGRNPRDR